MLNKIAILFILLMIVSMLIDWTIARVFLFFFFLFSLLSMIDFIKNYVSDMESHHGDVLR